MDTYEQTVAAIGPPFRSRSVKESGKMILQVAEFRHGPAQSEVLGADAVPIIIDLSEQHRVKRRIAGLSSGQAALYGMVTVVNPTERTTFSIEGTARVLQLFVAADLVDLIAEAPASQRIRARFRKTTL